MFAQYLGGADIYFLYICNTQLNKDYRQHDIANNSPLETGTFEHYLLFVSLGHTVPYQIHEPPGFNEETFKVQQDAERFGRDQINEEKLTFEAGTFEKGNAPQVIHPDGSMSEYLDMGLNWILETKRRFGFEGEIKRILRKDGVDFVVGNLDTANPDTDGATYFGCDIVNNIRESTYKKQFDSAIDLLSTKNIKDEAITPMPVMKFLLKSTPKFQTSTFRSGTILGNGLAYTETINDGLTPGFAQHESQATNNASISEITEIDNTLGIGITDFQAVPGNDEDGNTWLIPNGGGAFKIITALNPLTDVNFDITNIIGHSSFTIADSFSTHVLTASGYCQILLIVGEDLETAPFRVHKLYEKTYTKPGGYTGLYLEGPDAFPTSLSLNIPLIERGKSVFLYIVADALATFDNFTYNLARSEVSAPLTNWNIKVTATSNQLDNVISGGRYIDVQKQCAKFIDEIPVDAEIFDVGGEHYDNVCFNRALVSMPSNNSITLASAFLPEGVLGQVVNNINAADMPLGLYFWNGTQWISLQSDSITEISLTDAATPAGDTEGQLAYNANSGQDPAGLVYWNGTNWISLEYSKPFLTTLKDCFENAMTIETCSDYEITQDKITFKRFAEFYANIEMMYFPDEAPKDFKEDYNDRFKCNNGKYGYDTYEINRLSENTKRDIHTEVELSIPNAFVENKFERSIKYIRSGYSIQAMVDLEIKTPQTADENDDKVYIVRIVPMPSGTLCEFNAILSMQVIGGNVHLLNRDNSGNTDNVIINWNTRGFRPGDTFTITSGENAGTYTIVSFTNAELILLPVGFTPTFHGDSNIGISYTYTDVVWMTKTSEGMTVSGLFASEKYPNLDYTLRRNLANWESYFHSMCLAHEDKKIKKLAYKNNPKLKTQIGSGTIYDEAADIPVAGLTAPILGFNVYDTSVSATFPQVLQLLTLLRTQRGFIRCLNASGRIIKGYIQNLEYTWKSGLLKLRLEEKYEPDLITLVYADGILSVNDVPYDLQGNVAWWRISGDSFECFDANQRGISNIRHYSQVSLNGVIYTSIDDLYSALAAL